MLRCPAARTVLGNDSWIGFQRRAAEALVLGPACQHFSLEELQTATQSYSEANVLGEGGFGKARTASHFKVICHVGS